MLQRMLVLMQKLMMLLLIILYYENYTAQINCDKKGFHPKYFGYILHMSKIAGTGAIYGVGPAVLLTSPGD